MSVLTLARAEEEAGSHVVTPAAFCYTTMKILNVYFNPTELDKLIQTPISLHHLNHFNGFLLIKLYLMTLDVNCLKIIL